MTESKKGLRREIGTLGLTANIINIVIGAGIFVLPAIVAAGLGTATIVAYIFCGLLVALIMLCFAEVGSKITETGGVYKYIEQSFGRYIAFLTAYLIMFSNISGTAAVANAVIEVIFSIIPEIRSEWVRVGFFFFLFTGLAYINVKGLRKGVGLVKLVTFFKLAPLLLLVLIGLKEINVSNLYWDSFPSVDDIGTTSLVLFFAFTGFASAMSVSGEVVKPQRTVPRAILLSALLITVIYILIQTVSQGILGPSLATYTEQPLAEVASRLLGPVGFTLLTIGAAVSMFGNITSKVLSSPRILFAASKDMIIPLRSMARVHPRFRTPHIAIIVYASLCFLFASVSVFKQLAIISSATDLLVSLGICIAAIKLRNDKRFVNYTKGFKIPGGYTIPILASVSIFWFLSNLSNTNILGITISFAVLSVLYFVKVKARKGGG